MFTVFKIIAFIIFFIIGIQPVDSVIQVGLLSALLGVVLVGQWQIRDMLKKQSKESACEKDNENNPD